ncbi:cytochrome P450 [Kitasatospora sp. NPDC057223]|uniref:cytochrome P450 family protein n=1 Tax=Kitasatospora sp. NPDC057223 TaxID=3346055 RepID=UPI00362DF90A
MTDSAGKPRRPQDPYLDYARLRSECPVQSVPTGSHGHGSYLVTGYAQARQAFTAPGLSKDASAFFADKQSPRDLHPAVARNMLTTDPPQHTRLRSLVTKAFTPGTADRLRPYIATVTEDLLSSWSAGRQVDVIQGLAGPLPVTVICELLGVPAADRAEVSRWSDDLFATGRHEQIDTASHALADYMGRLVAAKRRRPDESVLADLIAVRDHSDRLSEEELVSLAVLLFVAGHETTTAAIGNAVLALLRHPEALRALRARPERIPLAVNELLRYDSPVGIATFRWTTASIGLGEHGVPADTPVLISPGAANRDPDRFPDPDRLDLDRDATGHLAFGHGIHRCLGAPLARAEIEIAVRAVVTRFPGLRLAVPPEQLPWRQARLIRGLVSLPVVL